MRKPKLNSKKHKLYIPKNTLKYIGRQFPVCRSSWEEKFCRWLDANPSVTEWISEGLSIPYYDPTQRRTRRYFPDFLITINNRETFVIEVKPYKETAPPKKTKNKSLKTLLYEEKTYMTNLAKWEAAKIFCEKMGYSFKILTERELLIGKK